MGPGTGNFGIAIHVFGFKVMAPTSSSGSVAAATNGFARDGTCPTTVLDINTTTAGPAAAAAAPIPAVNPAGLALLALVLAGTGFVVSRVS